MEPNREDSIITEYATLIKENKEKRKLRGEWQDNEPAELIFDPNCEGDFETDAHGEKIVLPWEYTNLISAFCVQDIFGDDHASVMRLLGVNPALEYVFIDNGKNTNILYFREQDIKRALGILTTLAKTNFVNTLRPIARVVKEEEPVYSGTDVMNLLDIKEERLRKFREKGYLGYTKYPDSDKIWYRKEDIEKFLNNPAARHEPWK